MSQSKTRTKKHQNEEISEAKFREVLAYCDFQIIDLNFAVSDDRDDIPYVVIDVSDMFGVEAHLFTAADMALWIPELLPSGNVVIYYPNRYPSGNSCGECTQSRLALWDALTRFLDWITHKVRVGRAEYGIASNSWAHCERKEDGYFEIPENTPQYIEKMRRRVDGYLPDVLLELNKQGFVTIESCSGLKEDHEDSTPFPAYVCFDDEYYLDVSAHLFTLAEASGFDPTFGAHGFDVLIYAHTESQKGLKKSWDRLVATATTFGEYLEEYRDLVDPWHGYYYYQFRSKRGFFSRCYDEGSQELVGLVEKLDTIDSEYFDNDKEE